MLAMSSEKRGPGRLPGHGAPAGTTSRWAVELRNILPKVMKVRYGIDNYHPVIAMAEIACDANNPLELRLDAHKAIAPYFQPKLQNIEVSGPEGGPLEVKNPLIDALLGALLSGLIDAKDITTLATAVAAAPVVEGDSKEMKSE